MAVALRLKRIGRRNRPYFRICVMDERTRRDGRTIEEIGHYNPLAKAEDPQFQVDEERARYWLSVGAQASETVAALLKRRSIVIPNARAQRRRRRAAKRAGRSQ
ncbi:MAG: 30S ribosomal protein S16 [Planctomycetota bacterium]|nr:MAG: 30S ribosomal protein S16 [Planctomycetota bacterium]